MTSGTLVLGGSGAHIVYPPMPAPCPPWCIGSPECMPTDTDAVRTRYHGGKETSVPLGPALVTVLVVVSRDDEPDQAAGQPYIYLAGDGPVGEKHDWAESMTPAAAIQLGQALIVAGVQAAGLAVAS